MKAEAQSSSSEKGEQYLSLLLLFTGVLEGGAEGGTKPKPKRTKMHELSTLRDSQKKKRAANAKSLLANGNPGLALGGQRRPRQYRTGPRA